MKRIANYRSGDRAEDFGITLLRSFCAVTQVPRQEDFGIVDAISTVLRRDGRLLYAEDSFAVQFKSRTEKRVEFRGKKFEALLKQELGLFIVHVNLVKADLKLFGVEVVLNQPHIEELTAAEIYFTSRETSVTDGVLKVCVGQPILHLTIECLEDASKQQNAYTVMKKWLEMERMNRQNRKLGIVNEIQWETNHVPSLSSSTIRWNPKNAVIPLTEILPSIQLIGALAVNNSQLADPLFEIMTWMRSHGVDPDPTGCIGLMVGLNVSKEQMNQLLTAEKAADIVIRLDVATNEAGCYAIWRHVGNGTGMSSHRFQASSRPEMESFGLVIEIDESTQKLVNVGLSDEWLSEMQFEVVGVKENMFLMKRSRTLEG